MKKISFKVFKEKYNPFIQEGYIQIKTVEEHFYKATYVYVQRYIDFKPTLEEKVKNYIVRDLKKCGFIYNYSTVDYCKIEIKKKQ